MDARLTPSRGQALREYNSKFIRESLYHDGG